MTENNEFKNLAVDYSEIIIDSLIDSGALKELPLIRSFMAINDVKKSFIANKYSKEILDVIQHKDSSEYSLKVTQRFQDFNDKLQLNTDLLFKSLLDNPKDSYEKSKIIANLFVSYINSFITIDDLEVLLNDVQKIPLRKFLNLKDFFDGNAPYEDDKSNRMDNLIEKDYLSAYNYGKSIEVTSENKNYLILTSKNYFILTSIGKKLIKYGMTDF